MAIDYVTTDSKVEARIHQAQSIIDTLCNESCAPQASKTQLDDLRIVRLLWAAKDLLGEAEEAMHHA